MEHNISFHHEKQIFIARLTARYHKEKQLADVISKMQTSAGTPQFKNTFSIRLQQVNERLQRIKNVMKYEHEVYGMPMPAM